MVQRKDSLSYGTFLRGKYKMDMRDYIMELFQNMTHRERERVGTEDFEALWKALWQITECNSFMREYEDAKGKFETLRSGYKSKDKDGNAIWFDIDYVISNTRPLYHETEWGFPKGRRNINESDIECAVRKFSEETSVPADHVQLIGDNPFDEVFTRGNRMRYRHVYYIGHLLVDQVFGGKKAVEPYTILQKREINRVEWFNYSDVQKHIRPYNKERKELIRALHNDVVRTLLLSTRMTLGIKNLTLDQ
jgi:ADP-ribose pyrophosphatase YjhB (NUDIX family)